MDERVLWEGQEASLLQCEKAFEAAHQSFIPWSKLSLVERIAILEKVVVQMKSKAEEIAESISMEMGKPLWESKLEMTAALGKLGHCVKAHGIRCHDDRHEIGGAIGKTKYKPHGVALILGPFNLPVHLPNGHMMPLLLAGNTVIFKPSEKVPMVSQRLMECFVEVLEREASSCGGGVCQVLQGGKIVAESCLSKDVQVVAFTGSRRAGVSIHKALAGRPEVLLALEMGGNNPLVVWDLEVQDAALEAMLQGVVRSTWVTSGQRCVCARRLIVANDEQGSQFVTRLAEVAKNLVTGYHSDESEPFMGPLVDRNMGQQVLDAQEQWLHLGGKMILPSEAHRGNMALISPGIVDMTDAVEKVDEEIFGPLLQVIRVESFEAALQEANRTKYGLAAGYFGHNQDHWDRFQQDIKAGVVNWNRPITGASSASPFGGWGWSGNHRPSAFLAADWCSQSQARLERPEACMDKPWPGSF
jgi:succinylglutamic semialdehyde dehydrogenase